MSAEWRHRSSCINITSDHIPITQIPTRFTHCGLVMPYAGLPVSFKEKKGFFLKRLIFAENRLKKVFQSPDLAIKNAERGALHMATLIWVNLGSGNGLLPYSPKPLPEPMFTSHDWGFVAFTWEQFHSECPSCYSVSQVWRLFCYNRFHVFRGLMN